MTATAQGSSRGRIEDDLRAARITSPGSQPGRRSVWRGFVKAMPTMLAGAAYGWLLVLEYGEVALHRRAIVFAAGSRWRSGHDRGQLRDGVRGPSMAVALSLKVERHRPTPVRVRGDRVRSAPTGRWPKPHLKFREDGDRSIRGIGDVGSARSRVDGDGDRRPAPTRRAGPTG